MFNVSVSLVQKCITESTTSSTCTPEMEAGPTLGKTDIWKNFIKNELR